MPAAIHAVRRLLLAVVVVVVLGAGGLVLHPGGRAVLIEFVEWLRSAGASGQLAAIGIVVVGIPLGFPTMWFAAILGFLYGMPYGVLLAIVVIPVGATLAFAGIRWLLQDDVLAIAMKRRSWVATLEALGDSGWRLVALLRLAGPHNLLNALLAASPVSTGVFVLGTVVGGAPSLALGAFGGALAPDVAGVLRARESLGALGTAVIVIGALCLIAAFVVVRRRVKAAIADAIAAQSTAVPTCPPQVGANKS